MTRVCASLLLVLLAAACGPSGATITTPRANAVYFWQLKTSSLEWGDCSDNAQFRSAATALEISENTFLVYKVDAKGKTATSQQCTSLDARSCTVDEATKQVFDIIGNELVMTQSNKEPVDGSTCMLEQTETWTLRDRSPSLEIEINDVLSLVDDEPACQKVEENVKKQSPNGLGIVGCVVTRRLTASLR